MEDATKGYEDTDEVGPIDEGEAPEDEARPSQADEDVEGQAEQDQQESTAEIPPSAVLAAMAGTSASGELDPISSAEFSRKT
eukprot:9212631-Pyramimonas_sp.AAC.1